MLRLHYHGALMLKRIQKVAVLGAGTMGSRIAAHLANAGVPSFLLDIVPPDADGKARNKIAQAGLDAAIKSKPAAFFEPSLARLVTIGNFEDNLSWVAEADWIIEVVAENLEIKRGLLQKVEAARCPGAITTTNTSGLPVAKIAEGFSEDFRRHWFGTHFFNPPRYMRLLEIIPTADTDRAAIDAIAHFADLRLGKGVVYAKDTPNFIANRIGTFSVLNAMRLMQEMDLTIEEVDALTGSAVGWPRSATFRTIDMVGLDILSTWLRISCATCATSVPSWKGRRSSTRCWSASGWATKPTAAFTRRASTKETKNASGSTGRRSSTARNRSRNSPRWKWRSRWTTRANACACCSRAIPRKMKAAAFLWTALADLWTYSANRIPEISDSIVEIDRAMRLGFNWELGPFELWDAAGVEPTVARMKKEGRPVAANVEKLLASGEKCWYTDAPSARLGRAYFDLCTDSDRPVQVPAGVWSVEVAKKANGVVKQNAGCSLVDLGDGVACLEFHSKDELAWRRHCATDLANAEAWWSRR